MWRQRTAVQFNGMLDGLNARFPVREHDITVCEERGVTWISANEPMARGLMKGFEEYGLSIEERLSIRL